jgi:two-component system OmpR family response regulator
MPDILVVDDDPHLREVVTYALGRAGFSVRTVRDGREALVEVDRRPPDLVVLDVMMPELDGLEVCRRIRAKGRLPIVFLSSRDEEVDRVIGLEMGGDDYITKPFSTRELVARVRAVLRRAAPLDPLEAEDTPLVWESLRLEPAARRVFVGEQEVILTATEFEMLAALLRSPGRVLRREVLAESTYGPGHHVADRTLDSHVSRMRRKLRASGVDPITAVRGVGYRLGH